MVEVHLDETWEDADWPKMTWDLPPYKSSEFMELVICGGWNLEDFRRLPVYKFAVARGVIVNDEWVGVKGR